MSRLRVSAALLTLISAFIPALRAPAQAQVLPGAVPSNAANGEGEQTAPPPAPQVDPELQRMLATPRTTMRKFMKAVEEGRPKDAAKALDVPELQKGRGSELAPRLKFLIDVMAPDIAYTMIPGEDQPDFEGPWQLSEEAENNLIGAEDIEDAAQIELVKGEDGLWRFSEATVAAIPELYERWQDRGLEELTEESMKSLTLSMRVQRFFPASLRESTFLLPDYQWICVIVVLIVGILADRLVRLILRSLTHAWVKYFARQKNMRLERQLWRPVGLFVQALIWFAGYKIFLPPWPPLVDASILVALRLFAIVTAVWTTFIFINLLASFWARKAAKTPTKFDDLLVPLVSKSLKILAVCGGLVSVALVFWETRSLAGVLTGLGIGGIALGLAAQDTLKNFFGSIMIFSDRPFELGDRIVIDGHDGPVESVGFRSTRIRTLEGNLVTIPNGELANKTILNIGKRPNIRRIMNITITYDTPREKVKEAVEIVREILSDHEGMDPEFPPRVYFNEFNADSLNIWAIYWFHPADWWQYCEFSERVNFEILRRYGEAGIEFAFPTRTLYLAGDPKRPLPPFAGDLSHNGEPARMER